MIRQDLACNKRVDIEPINTNMVYEPTFDENIPVQCFFTDKIYLAYRSYIGWFDKGKQHICNCTVKQCHYCKNLFAKTDDVMRKHLFICVAREGITYAFDKGQIINFQDNFKYLADVPFTVYFDFETTTDGSPFFDSKMFVVSYCQIYSFHLSLNLDNIASFEVFNRQLRRFMIEVIFSRNMFLL